MAQIRGGIAALFCLVWLLNLGAIASTLSAGTGPPMAFAAERKLLVDQSLKSTCPKNGRNPSTGNSTTWCVVKPSTSQEKLDKIIEYCCIQPGVNCSVIQRGGKCYIPPNKVSDASVVMNIFYKLNGKQQVSCDFNGSGLIVTEDPSVGKCTYLA